MALVARSACGVTGEGHGRDREGQWGVPAGDARRASSSARSSWQRFSVARAARRCARDAAGNSREIGGALRRRDPYLGGDARGGGGGGHLVCVDSYDGDPCR